MSLEDYQSVLEVIEYLMDKVHPDEIGEDLDWFMPLYDDIVMKIDVEIDERSDPDPPDESEE
jgi:hypothetical protein